jgi:hypothetical protein
MMAAGTTPPTMFTHSSNWRTKPTERGQGTHLDSNTMWLFIGVITGWAIAMAAVWVNYLQARNG